MSPFSLVTLRQALATVQNQMLDTANDARHGFGSAEYVRWANQADLIEASITLKETTDAE
jgi:hypothetical protein